MSENRVELEKPWGSGRVVWTRDATSNDSDKAFTVPAGKVWQIRGIWIEILCTATVGNRRLIATYSNGTNVIWAYEPVANTAAAQRGLFAAYEGATRSTSLGYDTSLNAVTIELTTPLMPALLLAGYIVRCYDIAAIDAAADDMIVNLHYIEYDA